MNLDMNSAMNWTTIFAMNLTVVIGNDDMSNSFGLFHTSKFRDGLHGVRMPLGSPLERPRVCRQQLRERHYLFSIDGIILELHTARRGPDYLARGRPDRLHDKGIGVADIGLVLLYFMSSFTDSNEADYLPIC